MTSTRTPVSVAVIGAGMAGRSHAAGYRNVNTVFRAGLPPVRLAAIADVAARTEGLALAAENLHTAAAGMGGRR
jgi:hypothetical protein